MRKYILLFLPLIIMACASPKVTVKNEAATTNWNNYKSFDFYKLDVSGDTVSAVFKERTDLLKTAIAKNLTARGLVQNNENPDLLINIGLVVKEKVQTRETSFTDPDRPKYMGTRNYSWKSETVETGRYREGFVTLDFIEGKLKTPLWQVSADGILPEKTEQIQKNIDQTIATILKDFPIAGNGASK
ncbi:DUF4136 domain-containing protein [Solitalea canadensis]|uniref:DUF4136 domain-containing protein n=1 Tax=Solitalea canadensis (strain ATCC 29591 / DSM 3403 / JCM 21819 / LMG 8368 / NBRC 15130 / NCIMB 12057 / USAM 9D) TaxID=929556 RepID=H8KM00_SOLCM|nr:DUF4136 domain-containing protein [Solitalea canadensis]AFD08922.1 hypothetical protein Solca_3927 [Solitalea canadensis DSM 3403]